ncbi:MAG: winged helix-turn-helix transcriptional regulator [Oscillospiraceae bacterium]|jgi:ATP-dependent DNA helicase RecG|nr:winged helix-turn-helix transcriptional regulator [Oscillospiraceae bacterium]
MRTEYDFSSGGKNPYTKGLEKHIAVDIDSAFGKPYIRVADEDRQMSAAELEKFILQKNAGRDSWDGELSDKTIDDVDEEVLKEYLAKAREAGRIDFEYTDRETVLRKLDVTNSKSITNAACAMFVGIPLVDVQMAVFATDKKLTFLDINRAQGSVASLIDIAVQYVKEKMNWRVVLDGSVQRKEIPDAPVDAIREAITNSFCHRDFRNTSQNNEVAIYSDRIEIYNPGRFPEGVTPEDYIAGRGPSIKRNPNLARLMYYSRDIESFGTGIQRIAEACEKAGVKVEFRNGKLGFSVIFYRLSNHTSVTDAIDNVTQNVTDSAKNITDDVTYGVTLLNGLSDIELQILKSIMANPGIGRAELASVTSKTTRTIQRYLNGLKKKNMIRRVGSSKSGYWEAVKPV